MEPWEIKLKQWLEQEIKSVTEPDKACHLCTHAPTYIVPMELEKVMGRLVDIQSKCWPILSDDILADPPTLAPIKVVRETAQRAIAHNCPFYKRQGGRKRKRKTP